MIETITKPLLEILKLAPRYLVAICVMAGFMLFAPDHWLERISVLQFAKDNRAVLGLALVVCGALMIVSISHAAVDVIRRWNRERKFYRKMTERLNCLTEDEKQILRYYIAKETRANNLRVDDGVVQGLVAEGIIYRSASMGNILDGFAHNISDFAWDYLHVHPHLLQGSTDICRTDKSRSIW